MSQLNERTSTTQPNQAEPGSFQHVPENELTNEWLLPTEAMAILRCRVNTLRDYRLKKLLPASKLNGRYFYNLADINHLFRWLRRQALEGK